MTELDKHSINGDKVFYFLQEDTVNEEITDASADSCDYLDVHFLESEEMIRYTSSMEMEQSLMIKSKILALAF